MCLCAHTLVGVHSSSCGFCEDIGGCHVDMHGKGLLWACACVHGNTGLGCIYLGLLSLKTEFMNQEPAFNW